MPSGRYRAQVHPTDRDVLLDAIGREAAAFTAVLETVDLAAPVRGCPGWDVVELAAHLAGTHRWARNAVVDGELRRDETPDLPDRRALVDWYRDSADRLLSALHAAAPGTPCPTFLTPDGTVEFWLRRQAHELAVHRYDAERAAGGTPHLDPELCADGVAEVLEVMVPRMRARGLLGDLPTAVRLERSDGAGTWVLGEGAPAATVRADAATLLLLLWKRTGLDACVAAGTAGVHGDADVARAVLQAPVTP